MKGVPPQCIDSGFWLALVHDLFRAKCRDSVNAFHIRQCTEHCALCKAYRVFESHLLRHAVRRDSNA
jgi:hypothetical protein